MLGKKNLENDETTAIRLFKKKGISDPKSYSKSVHKSEPNIVYIGGKKVLKLFILSDVFYNTRRCSINSYGRKSPGWIAVPAVRLVRLCLWGKGATSLVFFQFVSSSKYLFCGLKRHSRTLREYAR